MVFKVINLDEVTKGGKRPKELKAGDPILRGTNRGYWEGSSREVGKQPGQSFPEAKRNKPWKEEGLAGVQSSAELACMERRGERLSGKIFPCLTKKPAFLPQTSMSWYKVSGWVGRYVWFAFVICNPSVLTLPWLLKILARNISYPWGMYICYIWLVDKWIRMLLHQFAIQSLCGLKQSWKSASQSPEWSPNSLACLIGFRRHLVSHCPLILTLPPSLASSTLTHTWHSITRGQLPVLSDTLFSSMSLLSPHALHYACHTLAGFFCFWPWKWRGPCELLPRSPMLVYLLFFSWLYPPVGFLHHIEMVSMSVSRWVLYGLQRGGSQVAYLFLLLCP